jgi:hypothetical protein
MYTSKEKQKDPPVIIRKQQLTFLNEHQAAIYELRLSRFLREQFLDAAEEDPAELRREVAGQIHKGRTYGCEDEQDVAAYVITAWLLGTDFDTRFPAAHDVLTSSLSGKMKARFLEQWTKEMLQELER